jgi:cytoskeletal protein RodZ
MTSWDDPTGEVPLTGEVDAVERPQAPPPLRRPRRSSFDRVIGVLWLGAVLIAIAVIAFIVGQAGSSGSVGPATTVPPVAVAPAPTSTSPQTVRTAPPTTEPSTTATTLEPSTTLLPTSTTVLRTTTTTRPATTSTSSNQSAIAG